MISCPMEVRSRLLAVGQELAAPDLLLRGGSVYSPFTGDVSPADVAVCADRVGRVGAWKGPVSVQTAVLDIEGRVVVPGYIEPHTHPWPFVNPLALGEGAVCRGTTCLVYDDLLLHLALGIDGLLALTRTVSERSIPHVWWVARMASQSRFEGEEAVFSLERVGKLLSSPHFLGTGEMTRWTELLDPERGPRLLEIIELARALGKFADGHTAGASMRRLPALAATGIRSCHEAITAEEALARLRQGLWVLLRNSSLRTDLVELLPVLEQTGFADRLTFTTDGAKAHHVAEVGLTDFLIRTALAQGVPAAVTYRMATLNAATFLGLDQDLGAVAPGRVADLNVLTSLDNPTPELVVCRGRVVAREGRLVVPAPSAAMEYATLYRGGEPPVPAWQSGQFLLPRSSPSPFPAGRLVNAVITREEEVRLTEEGSGLWPDHPDAMVLALTDRSGSWLTQGVILGLAPELEALASTYTTNAGLVVLGKSVAAMAEALAAVREMGGGMAVLPASGRAERFPLPLAGIQMAGDFERAAAAASSFQEALVRCGYPHSDPNYTLLFLSCDFLPDLRATQAGWIRSKTGEVVVPSQRLVG